MKQAYHSNAKTNVHTRQLIRQSHLTHEQLVDQYAISKNTVRKWSNRASCEDKSSKPHKTHGMTPLVNNKLPAMQKRSFKSA